MFCQSFPDLDWLKQQAEARFSNKKGWNDTPLPTTGWPTVILQVKTRETYRDNILGPLSFFSNESGKSWVENDDRKTYIGDDYFYLSNSEQRYTLGVETAQSTTQTFNIHFGDRWAEEVMNSFSARTENLLDSPDLTQESLTFYNRLYPKTETIRNLLQQLSHSRNEGSLKRDEVLFQLMVRLLNDQHVLRQRAQGLPSLNKSTREEILKRLFRVSDYIYSHANQALTLDELASIGCLSKFHFLRLFKQFFKETPHQFVTRVRIEKSKTLLRKPIAIRSVADAVGFQDASSFSRSFFRQTGVYPETYRSVVL